MHGANRGATCRRGRWDRFDSQYTMVAFSMLSFLSTVFFVVEVRGRWVRWDSSQHSRVAYNILAASMRWLSVYDVIYVQ